MKLKKKWLNRVKKDKRRPLPTNRVRYPFGTETLNKSTETPYGTHPKSEVTQPEKIYDSPSSYRADHSNDFPGKGHGYWPISTSISKKWLDTKKRGIN